MSTTAALNYAPVQGHDLVLEPLFFGSPESPAANQEIEIAPVPSMASTAEATAQVADQRIPSTSIPTAQGPADQTMETCWEKIAVNFDCHDPDCYESTPLEKCTLKTRGKAVCLFCPCLTACAVVCGVVHCFDWCCVRREGRRTPCDFLNACAESLSQRYEACCACIPK